MHAEFDVCLSREKLLRHYRGEATGIVVTTRSGTTLQLPAVAFRRFVTSTGLRGRFRVEYCEQRRLRALRRLA